MAFRNIVRNFTLNHRFTKKVTSNVEVLEEIPIENQETLSAVETKVLNGSQQTNSHKLKNLINYFNSNTSLQDLKKVIPASLLLKKHATNSKRGMFLIDRDIGANIFKLLQPNFANFNGHVMEICAGAGVLTEELLKAKLKNLRIYEPDAVLCNHLLKLIKLYKSDARLFMANMLALGSILKADAEDNKGRIETLFDSVVPSPWEDGKGSFTPMNTETKAHKLENRQLILFKPNELRMASSLKEEEGLRSDNLRKLHFLPLDNTNEPAMKLIGVLPNERFIFHMMLSITLQSGFCKYGRPELFLILPQEGYKKLIAKPSDQKLYKSRSVVFQVLFDYEVLALVPGNVFVPWSRSPSAKKDEKQCNEISDHLCLVKLSPKKDLLQTIRPDLLKSFWIFVNLMMHKKSSLLIDKMEKWVPGSGVRLILNGYTIFSDCGSLTPEEYLKLYLQFTSWPEFYSSSFIPSAEGFHEKLLHNTEDIVSDEKFRKLFWKLSESNLSEEDVDFDDVKSSEHSDKIPSTVEPC